MLWAPLKPDIWKNVPDEWEVVISAHRFLQKYTLQYQLIMERSMFGGGVEYRCVLVRWDGDRTRNVILETTDPKHAESILAMLISEAKHAVHG
jgi:hypothetical protein